jgi:hypothetical protein
VLFVPTSVALERPGVLGWIESVKDRWHELIEPPALREMKRRVATARERFDRTMEHMVTKKRGADDEP